MKDSVSVEPAELAEQLIAITKRLSARVGKLTFSPPVTHVYNPLVYAWAPHKQYLHAYGAGTGRTLLLGMNPGPFGMAQTGVPFGEVSLVRDWLGIHDVVKRPKVEHPARIVQGFDCPRSEVSGARLWGWAQQRFGTPQRFFEKFFVVNYCPLVFMDESGKNRTPDKLLANERSALFSACDVALAEMVACLKPQLVIGVGAFAKGRAGEALADSDVTVGQILHPSPASPKANAGWADQIERQLTEMGCCNFDR